MRLVVAGVLALVTTLPAAAEEDTPCEVRVVRAPAEVRAAIEARIGIETGCTTLDVRVIAVRDGYYVVATSPNGELFEGSVREPGIVGELVTSWARLPSEQEYDDEDEDEENDDAVASTAALPPGATPPQLEAREEGTPRRSRSGTRDLALGVHASDRGFGVRGELDIVAARGFSIGIALGVATSSWSFAHMESASEAHLGFRDARALLVAAKTFGRGAWRLRVQGGIGVMQTTYAGVLRPAPRLEQPVEGEGTTRMAEAAISVSREVTRGWALSFGPLLSYYGQAYSLEGGSVQLTPRRELDVAGVVTLRRRM